MAEPRRAVLNNIRSMNDIYDQLARQLGFPADFGRNLDALHDVLTGSLEGPVQIVWRGCLQALPVLGQEQFEALLATFNDVAGERSDVEVMIG
ncbi:barstar family protein [Chitinolyticbacter albus]|uniref:barstar family protein n=1 Tax=Chitinolyticbacter albus TaxID=2961951 RepID=UPI00210BBC63|nr:barstar family protein [Chitinolyticbacter albus]